MLEEISVIIPVYNHAHTLERSLRSLAAQTIKPLEVIIINDGSTDNFNEVIKQIKKNLPIKIIEQENKGANAARNLGWQMTTGDYIIFWDADTVAQPEMLEKMFQALKNNPQASYAYSQYKFGWKKMTSHIFDPKLLQKINYVDQTSLVRRSDLPSGGCDASLRRFQDWDLWLTMLEDNKTGVLVPEVLYKKIVRGRKGISSWLPKFIFKLPWKIEQVKEYEKAREIILKKHGLKAPPANMFLSNFFFFLFFFFPFG